MKINYVEDIREEFRRRKASGLFRGPTIEIQNAMFRVDHPTIFGSANEAYVKAELEWYKSRSLNVEELFKIYGKEVKIWKDVASKDGFINSNYGWCVYSAANGDQYRKVLNTLWDTPESRQAVMYYTRPTMHDEASWDGMRDHMCTTHVQYFINNNYLECQVNMRSNDAIFGFINDFAWQRHVLVELAEDLSHAHQRIIPGSITWNAGSLHIYDRHYDLIT